MQRFVLTAVVALLLCWQVGATAPQPRAGQRALQPLQALVGEWNGVGQPRRGNTQGAWTEKNTWKWQFSSGPAALTFQANRGKYFSSGRLTAAKDGRTYRLQATGTVDKQAHIYTGNLNAQNVLVLKAEAPKDGLPARISMRFVASDKRLIVLYERQSALSSRYVRLSEVGYTRRGSNFGKTTEPNECIVTGGRGTIAVTFEGKTYYVCCGGCKDYFEENPAAVLAEYRARQAAAKEGASSQP
ncbi:MAG: hypothetical protein CL681_22650 [Blastopirellula sp.]|nr:hypothetical protein [Blastopirellula sp.]